MRSLCEKMTCIVNEKSNANQRKSILLGFICFLTIVASFLFANQGAFVNDEETYLLMARNFAESGGLAIWNGYQEYPSAELVFQHTVAHEGRLVPHYPYLFPVLSFPLYQLFGNQGLLVLNAIAYAATVGVCFCLARILFRDAALALNACLILVFATFSWEYSQAIWPHAVSMLFVTASVYCAALALLSPGGRKSAALALAAGVVAGFGAGVRLDTIFVLPGLIVPFMFVRPWRPWCVLAACLGVVPGLAVLAATNYAKFGVVSAFTYTSKSVGGSADPISYLPIVFLGTGFLAGAWMISRSRGKVLTRTNRWVVAVGLVVLGGIVFLTPVYWGLVSRMAEGTYQLLVDLRIRDLDYSHGGLTRGPGGALVYIGGAKKALLQSCPYHVLLVVPITMLLRGTKHGLALGMLFLAPAAFVAPYAFYAWDGGLSLNLRYFTPILPFTSILAAFAWRQIVPDLRDPDRLLAVISGCATAALYAMILIIGPALLWDPLTIAQQEMVFLTLPLAIAVCALALIVARLIKPRSIPRAALPAVMAVGFVWSGLVAFAYDYPPAYEFRTSHATLSSTLERLIERDSLVIAYSARNFVFFPNDHRVRVAKPQLDDFKDFLPLVEFHMDRNRAVYTWLTEAQERKMRDRRLLDDFALVPVYEHRWGRLAQLVRPSDEHGTETPVN